MSEPQRRQVRVRRSPKITVFLAIGAVLGALLAVVAVNLTPADPTVPKVQAIGFLILLLAPVGALLAGAIALLIDRASERGAKTVDADWTSPTAAPGPVEDAVDPDGRGERDAAAQDDVLRAEDDGR